jgi:hypothetical protein
MTKEQIETLRAWSHTIKSEKAEIETVLLQRILEDCLQFYFEREQNGSFAAFLLKHDGEPSAEWRRSLEDVKRVLATNELEAIFEDPLE